MSKGASYHSSFALGTGRPPRFASGEGGWNHVNAYSQVRYDMYIAVSITRFRKDSFSLAEAALKGNVVEFVHKGVTFKVIPDKPTDKLSNITPLKFISPDYNLESSETELLAEMEKEWEKDWSQL